MTTRYIDILRDWNFWDKKIDAGILRPKYVEKLLWYADFQEIIAISGVRRSGKSTLLRQIIAGLNKKKGVPFKNTLHINFEDPRLSSERIDATDLFEIFKEYREEFKPKGKIYVFLDEVQKITRWEQFVRTIYDLPSSKNKVHFFVTGSNSSVFASNLITSLTGRLINFSVSPLSFAEFVCFPRKRRDFSKAFEEYTRFGGFPQVVLEKDENKKRDLLISYYNAIVENDIVIRHGIRNKKKIIELAKYLLSTVGSLVSTYSLEKTLGIGNADISRYLNYIEESYLISSVPLFSYSVKKQIYNPDKVFAVDTGLSNVAGFNFSENRGRLLENLVYQKLRQGNSQAYYWKNKTEIDFLTFAKGKVEKLINVTLTVDDPEVLQRELNSLDMGSKEFPKAESILLSLYNQSKQKDKRIRSLTDFLLDN